MDLHCSNLPLENTVFMTVFWKIFTLQSETLRISNKNLRQGWLLVALSIIWPILTDLVYGKERCPVSGASDSTLVPVISHSVWNPAVCSRFILIQFLTATRLMYIKFALDDTI